MCKQCKRRHSNKIYSNTKQNYNKHLNIKLETIYLSFQPFFFFLLILFLKISPMYTPSTTKNLILIQIPTNCSNERHKNSHSAKQKQGKEALFWCAELDLADRTLFTAPNRQQPTVGHPVCC